MANSYNVSGLPAYVDQNRPLLLNEAILGGISAREFTLMAGVKSSAALNILTSDVQFGDGSVCGWNEAGSSTLSQRVLETGQIKVNMAICDKTLLGKWAEYQVRIAAGQKNLPFEEDLMRDLSRRISNALEVAIWQGDKTSGTANLNKFDGMIKLLSAAGSGAISSTKPAGETTKIAAVKRALLAMPAGTLTEDAVIFCGTDFLRDYEQELVAANLFHFEPGMDYDSIRIPGSRVRLIATVGLDGQNYLVAGQLSNFFFGCDLMDDSEKFEVWYSQDNREFRIAVEFNAGVQVAFPGNVVIAGI